MAYCIECGIKLSNNYIKCPLCQRDIEFPVTTSKKYPDYPNTTGKIIFFKVKRSGKKRTIVNLVGFMFLLITSILLGINYISSGLLSWSKVTTATFVYIFLSIYIITVLSSSPYILYSILNFLLGTYLFSLDILTSEPYWFIEYALRCFIYLQFLSLASLIIFKAVKSNLYRSSVIVLFSSIYLILVNLSISNKVSWSLITSSILLPTTLFLIVLKLSLPKPSDLK